MRKGVRKGIRKKVAMEMLQHPKILKKLLKAVISTREQVTLYFSTVGIVSVGMGIGSAYGLCQLLGFFFTNMHGLLPFLMLGVGIDDMFVIMQVALNV